MTVPGGGPLVCASLRGQNEGVVTARAINMLSFMGSVSSRHSLRVELKEGGGPIRAQPLDGRSTGFLRKSSRGLRNWIIGLGFRAGSECKADLAQKLSYFYHRLLMLWRRSSQGSPSPAPSAICRFAVASAGGQGMKQRRPEAAVFESIAALGLLPDRA